MISVFGAFVLGDDVNGKMFGVGLSVAVFLENGNLMKKMSFPRATLPAIVLLSALVNFAIVFGILGIILGFHHPRAAIFRTEYMRLTAARFTSLQSANVTFESQATRQMVRVGSSRCSRTGLLMDGSVR